MTEVQRRIGLMGGTFDPIHYGHLVTAEAARYKYLLDEVIFVPSGNPPHKKERRISSADDRLMMSTLATVTNSFFSVSDLEIIRGGYSYTYDTVREFKQLYPHSEIYFITGADAISEIITWKKVELLFDQCYFIAATRPGFDFDEL
ncbi:MAG: nicotinate-nucleotide adenylyltransferase, partial [Clostridiales bacterium]